MMRNRKAYLISTFILITIVMPLIGLIGHYVALRNYNKSLDAIGEYVQSSVDTDSPVTLSELEMLIRGATSRTETTKQDGTSIVVHTWRVLGAIETEKRFYVQVSGNTENEQAVLLMSRDPI